VRGVLPVHYGGLPCAMEGFEALSQEYGLALMDDAAHALPAQRQGRTVGTIGDVTAFSFYATKTITTGEGGMVVVRDAAVAARCRVMRLHGIDRDAFDRYVETRPSWYYEVVAPGFKYNMTDIAASLGLHQLKKARAFQRRRQTIAEAYSRRFDDLPVTLPARAAPGELHAWHLYLLRLRDGAPVDRDELIARLAAEGIGTSVHFVPLHQHSYYRDSLGYRPSAFPNAERESARMFSLPLFCAMQEADVDRVADTLRTILRRARR